MGLDSKLPDLKYLLFIAPVLLSGCYGTVPLKLYQGPSRPQNEIAVLTESIPFNVKNINGRSVDAYTKDIQLLPGEYGVSINYYESWQSGNTIYTNYSIEDHLCLLDARPNSHYFATGEAKDKNWVAYIVDDRKNLVSRCELVPRRMGDQVFIDEFLPRTTLIEYDMPDELKDIAKGVSLVVFGDKRHIFISYPEGYGELVGLKNRWTEKGFSYFGSINSVQLAIIFKIPKDLNDDATMLVYPKGSWKISDWIGKISLTDFSVNIDLTTLHPYKINTEAISEEERRKKKAQSANTYR